MFLLIQLEINIILFVGFSFFSACVKLENEAMRLKISKHKARPQRNEKHRAICSSFLKKGRKHFDRSDILFRLINIDWELLKNLVSM